MVSKQKVESFDFAGQTISSQTKPFIIAELSGNHNQSLDTALKIIEKAAEAGVDAVKLQTYTADTLTLNVKNDDFKVSASNKLWGGAYLYDLYKKAYTPWEWHEALFEKCKEVGVIGFSTPFDESAVNFLETLNVPGYKIASFENKHLPLLKKVAATGKPVIMSTGTATLAELWDSVRVLRDHGCKQLALLKCTSAYPADPTDINLATIPYLQDIFNCQVGFSDHTVGIGAPVAAVALGASILEKHVTLNPEDKTVDSAFSLDTTSLKTLVHEVRAAWQAVGTAQFEPTKNEHPSLRFCRSVYVAKTIKKGEVFSQENLRIVRPGTGLPVKHLDIVLGKKASRDLDTGTALSWAMIS